VRAIPYQNHAVVHDPVEALDGGNASQSPTRDVATDAGFAHVRVEAVMKRNVFSTMVFGVLLAASASAQGPDLTWIEVPVVSGPSGGYTCVTRPSQGSAVITCDPYKLAMIPPAAQTFLMAHEHGHVLQFVRGTQFAPNPEADADCYAAKRLALTDPQTLAAAIQWLEHGLGTGGGDLIHGNGIQVAAFARQCAAQVGVPVP
jgi:hypothetical protein